MAKGGKGANDDWVVALRVAADGGRYLLRAELRASEARGETAWRQRGHGDDKCERLKGHVPPQALEANSSDAEHVA